MIKNNQLLSIIVPIYNVEDYLEDCLESILKTDIKETEIILVDDGSTDNSNQLIRKFKQKDNRVKIIVKENGGLSSARNAGLNIARGEYILFIDSDDILYPEPLSRALENAMNDNSEIVIFDYFEFEDLSNVRYRYDRAFLPERLLSDHELILNKLFYMDINFAVWNKLYKHSFLRDNNLSFKENTWFEDLDFIFKAVFRANVISKENSILIGYRQRKGSIMKTVSPRVLDKKEILFEIKEFLETHGEMQTFEEAYKFLFFKMYISIIYQVLKNTGQLREKREILTHIFYDSYFYNVVLSSFTAYRKLSLSEKLLFMQLKYKVLNMTSLSIYNLIT